MAWLQGQGQSPAAAGAEVGRGSNGVLRVFVESQKAGVGGVAACQRGMASTLSQTKCSLVVGRR